MPAPFPYMLMNFSFANFAKRVYCGQLCIMI